MQRNGPLLPLIALVAAVALFLAVGLRLARGGDARPALSVVQIGMIALGMALFLYGAIGALSIWLEGRELRVQQVPARLGRPTLIVGWIGVVALVVLSGVFARLIWTSAAGGVQDTMVQGSLAAAICLLAAVLVLVYRRGAVADEVAAEELPRDEP